MDQLEPQIDGTADRMMPTSGRDPSAPQPRTYDAMELNPVGAGSSPQQQRDLLEKLADVEALMTHNLSIEL